MMGLFIGELMESLEGPCLPLWLKTGLEKIPQVLTEGVPGFVKACGRSSEHVSRATRKHLGATPGELINKARMNYTAQQLRMTDAKILDIMFDCGLNNPSHFYELFRSQYGETPRQYRLRRMRLIGQVVEQPG